MHELLAALSSVDPPHLVAWSLLAFAAGMYPVGLMLGATCNPCCGCTLCTEGQLPQTLTVTFDGLQDKTQSEDLITLGFTSCFGSGAAGRVLAPGGEPGVDEGPISSVSLTASGSGYAKVGRVEPTVTAGGGSGSGATFTVTLSKLQDACNVDYWQVKSVTASGGTGYVDNESLTFTVASGDTEEQGAEAYITTQRSAPTLTASVAGGSGAALTVNITTRSGTPTTWRVSSISVTNGGTGYSNATGVVVAKDGDDVELATADAIALVARSQPTLTAAVASNGGSGCTLTVTLTQGTDIESRAMWYVSALTVGSAGSGYVVGDQVVITVTDGEESGFSTFSASVSSVDGSGGVTGIQIDDGGEYYKYTGVIDSILLFYGGIYYSDDGAPSSVTVTTPGKYYREDATATPYVSAPTVTITQAPASAGTGAVITANVNSTVGNADFGKVTSLTITNAGSDYLAWLWRYTQCCGEHYNGMTVVLLRNNSDGGSSSDSIFDSAPLGCRYTHRFCGVGNNENNPGFAQVRYFGPSQPPVVYLRSEGIARFDGSASSDAVPSDLCNTNFTTESLVADCSDWTDEENNPLVFDGPGGETATVTAGGTYDPGFLNFGERSCAICCKGDAAIPAEIEVNVTDSRTIKNRNFSGTYVLPWGCGVIPNYQKARLSHCYYGEFLFGEPGDYDSIVVRVRTEMCATRSGSDDFEPDEWGCDECHKSCRVIGSVGFSDGENAGGEDPQITIGNACSECEVTPVCSLSGRSFSKAGVFSMTVD